MLTRSFIHVPGIGRHRERVLWDRGYTDWDRFLGDHPPGAWRDLIASRLDPGIAARDLPRAEAWRLLPSFAGRTVYLDIETEGLGPDHDRITCIGLSDGRGVEVFVEGENLQRFPEALERFELVVTYNGSCFDLPVLQGAFPGVDFRRLHHLDLRYPLRRLGLRGGLKRVERAVGLERAAEIEGADGFMAVLLWRAHRAGHPRALETLVHYCLADVVSLKPLAAHVYNRLSAELPLDVPPVGDVAEPEIPFRADGALVAQLLGRCGGEGRFPPAWARDS